MTSEKAHNSEQKLLFDSSGNWNDPRPLDGVPQAIGEPGSYVNVEERAELLITALGAFSARNSRRTFPLAAYTSESSPAIWARYQELTEPVIIPGARRNANMYDRMAAHSFWRATGFSALKKVTNVEQIIRPKQIDERAIKMWDDFNDLYSRPEHVKERNKYKKLLGKFVTQQAKSEEQAA